LLPPSHSVRSVSHTRVLFQPDIWTIKFIPECHPFSSFQLAQFSPFSFLTFFVCLLVGSAPTFLFFAQTLCPMLRLHTTAWSAVVRSVAELAVVAVLASALVLFVVLLLDCFHYLCALFTVGLFKYLVVTINMAYLGVVRCCSCCPCMYQL
jgi:hypothetical protein